MSERPNFVEVLAEHTASPWVTNDGSALHQKCSCGTKVPEGQIAAHLAAVLNAEVDRWLADEGTRDMESCSEFGSHPRGGHQDAVLARAAALATPTVPTAEEER